MGQGLAASVVCMYVRPSRFWIQLIFGKDRSGFRNTCHVPLENVAQKDGRTWRLGGRTFVLELSKPERL